MEFSMDKRIFSDAAEVKRFLREAGFREAVGVRLVASPFGGSDRFLVNLPGVPEPVSIISGTDPTTGRHSWWSDDNNATAVRFEALDALLVGTNASAGGRKR
jgi:hypothetical protein